MICKDHSEAEEPWMCECTATKISNLEMKLEAYKNPGKAKDKRIEELEDIVEIMRKTEAKLRQALLEAK